MLDFSSHPQLGLTETRFGWMFYPRNDLYVGRSLELYGEYCRLEYELFTRLVRQGDTVVDIGANIGAHTVLFSRLVGGTGRVMAFEPQTAIFQILCANLMLNGGVNVHAIQSCVGRSAGTLAFPQGSLSDALNFGGVSVFDRTRPRQDVSLVALDDLRLEACHLLKIDVEGMEADVFAGAFGTIERLRPVVYAEADSLEQVDQVKPWFDRLRSLGYTMLLARPLLYVPANWKNNSDNVFGRTININILAFPGAVPDWATLGSFRFHPLPSFDDYLESIAQHSRAR